MTIKVNLTRQKYLKIEPRELLLPEKEVKVIFTSDVYQLGTLLLTVSNEEEKRRYKTNGEAVDITDLCNKAGRIEMEISKMVGGDSVKSWRTEPLLLRELEHGLEAIPEIEAVKEELNMLKAAVKELAALLIEKETI